jgi:pectate lyase
MKKLLSTGMTALLSVLLMTAPTALAKSNNLGLEVLAENDGWAAYGEGTTGGVSADKSHVYTVTNKSELMQALDVGTPADLDNDTPKIIYVKGLINIDVDENGNPLEPEDYAVDGYDFQKYLDAFTPDGKQVDNEEQFARQEATRRASQKNQKENMIVRIGSNTSIIGVGENSKIIGGNLSMEGVHNIIIRNLEVEAPRDYFPSWDPKDGETGHWNSEYDAINIKDNTNHVWIDHNTLSDGNHPESESGKYFGMKFQQHDGLLDITNGANYVTVSYNIVSDHGKTMLIGSSDSRTSDSGKLKVTLHHNYFKNMTERFPRVRFGEVHVYNNYYEHSNNSEYEFSYAIGAGKESKIYAENNYFSFDWDVDPSTIIQKWGGESIYENGSYVNGPSSHNEVDLVAAYNASHEGKLNEDVGWKPTLYDHISPTQSVPGLVKAKAGVGHLK